MKNVEDEHNRIIEFYPNAIFDDNNIFLVRIPVKNEIDLELNFKNYPKKPKVRLIKKNGFMNKKLNNIIPSLKRWENKNPLSIIELINEILLFIKHLEKPEINIKRGLLQGILALCKDHHPREILGLLRVINGIVEEYILPPGAITSKHSGLYYPNRLGFDSSLMGSIHSHPSGHPYPSIVDINHVFKGKRYNFIIAYPYNLRNMKCFNSKGKEIEFKLVD